MPDLATALIGPIAKLLLKSWIGDVGSEVGWGLFEVAKQKFADRRQAAEAQRKATTVASAVVADLERYFATERSDAHELEAAAHELGVTIERHVQASFLVHHGLAPDAIAAALLEARPPEDVFGKAEPAHALYEQLVEALAPRLRAVAPELPDYGLARDAEILARLERLAAEAPVLLNAVQQVERKVEELAERPRRLAEGFERHYLDALVKELDYVEILGIEELDSKSRRADLSIAYLSLMLQLGVQDETRASTSRRS